eukprot:1845485-Amphidinium_carterae.2
MVPQSQAALPAASKVQPSLPAAGPAAATQAKHLKQSPSYGHTTIGFYWKYCQILGTIVRCVPRMKCNIVY